MIQKRLRILGIAMLLFAAWGCQKDPIITQDKVDNLQPALSQTQTPNLEQRKATDDNLKILALGLTDLVKDSAFTDLLRATLPCDGWLELDEFSDLFRLATDGRELYGEMNAAIAKYLSADPLIDYVGPAQNGLIIDDLPYTADITIPYFDATDLDKPMIAAAGVDDIDDRLTGYLVNGRDAALYFQPGENALVSVSAAEIHEYFLPPYFEGFSGIDGSLFGQPVSAQEALLRPVIVIAPGDGTPSNRFNDPCYYANGGGNGNGSSSGGVGNPGCSVSNDEDCAYKTGPTDTPGCITGCDVSKTPLGQCLTTVRLVDGTLNATHNSGSNMVKVRYMISRMNPVVSLGNEHLGVGNNTDKASLRIDLEDRANTNVYNNVTYNNLEILHSSMICQLWGFNNFTQQNGPVQGFGLNSFGTVTSNQTLWYFSRYWITIYEDDWWVTNRKEIHPPGINYFDLDQTHRIRATASSDLFYNGIIVLDNYGCSSFICDTDYLDDGWPGQFQLEVGI